MNHHNNFNFLRIFAAVLVGVTHSYAITGNILSEPARQLSNGYFYLSSIGLYIFFFTSGYLVSQSAATSKSSLIFLQKRVLRIYPALIIAVLLSVFIAGPLLTTFTLKQYFTDVDTWKYLWTASGYCRPGPTICCAPSRACPSWPSRSSRRLLPAQNPQ